MAWHHLQQVSMNSTYQFSRPNHFWSGWTNFGHQIWSAQTKFGQLKVVCPEHFLTRTKVFITVLWAYGTAQIKLDTHFGTSVHRFYSSQSSILICYLHDGLVVLWIWLESDRIARTLHKLLYKSFYKFLRGIANAGVNIWNIQFPQNSFLVATCIWIKT